MVRALSKEEFESVIGKNSMKRAVQSEEGAKMIMVLESDLCSYVTGQIIRVDSGMN